MEKDQHLQSECSSNGRERKSLYPRGDEEFDGTHLSDMTYFSRSDNPNPPGMARSVVLQQKWRKKHLHA